jgi:hypothetical protein
MPIRVRYKNIANQECTIRPTPLVSISSEMNKTPAGDILGVTYTITLTGKLLADEGTPYALDITGGRYPFAEGNPNAIGPYYCFDNNISHFQAHKPPRQLVPHGAESNAIFMKQRALRELFANHGQRVEITDVEFDSGGIVCFPRVVNISFSEGVYVNTCDYTITLEADLLYSTAGGGTADGDGMRDQSDPIGNSRPLLGYDKDFVNEYGNAFISDFSESWALEVDESQGEVVNLNDDSINISYRITHNISATGKDHYAPIDANGNETVRLIAWASAKKFVQARLAYNPANYNDILQGDGTVDHSAINQGYPNQTGVYSYASYPLNHPLPNFLGKIGAGTLDLMDDYGGYNHSRVENIDETAGTYSVTETWLLARGSAYETYNMSLNSSTGSPFVSVSINGNIKGLSPLAANAVQYGGKNNTLRDNIGPIAMTKYESALNYYNKISNNQSFGVGSLIYKRANNQTQVQLNAEPLSIALGMNKHTGEITYALEFNNRPTNIISNVVSENININDTYPGDIFSVIPVIGRATGPILQYIGGRSEYKRDISISLIMDQTKIPYGSDRSLLLAKPSVNEPTATELAQLLEKLSPANEPGVRKYFINAPSESWEPKTGSYSFNISFVYELDK